MVNGSVTELAKILQVTLEAEHHAQQKTHNELNAEKRLRENLHI